MPRATARRRTAPPWPPGRCRGRRPRVRAGRSAPAAGADRRRRGRPARRRGHRHVHQCTRFRDINPGLEPPLEHLGRHASCIIGAPALDVLRGPAAGLNHFVRAALGDFVARVPVARVRVDRRLRGPFDARLLVTHPSWIFVLAAHARQSALDHLFVVVMRHAHGPVPLVPRESELVPIEIS